MNGKRTVVVGASTKPERYSNQAVRMLKSYGHEVVPIHPLHSVIENVPAATSLENVHGPVDTVTMYVNASQSAPMESAIKTLKPSRVVFNPGSENPSLEEKLRQAGIAVVHGCTLVMLRTGQY